MNNTLNFAKKLWDKVKNYLFIFWIFVGVISFFIPQICQMLDWSLCCKYEEIIHSIAASILASGVLASISKSALFTEIFREVVEDVFYKDKHLTTKNQEELKNIWQRVSKVIYHDKFPKISDEIQQHILNTYFPSEHKY
ncbi:MAG: hypothetical protein IJ797_01400 [Selenomonadaceae bacterium]|nr:hypothetical protein [Selenomonadaceae bacterium]